MKYGKPMNKKQNVKPKTTQLQKNETIETNCIAMSYEGKGLIKIDDQLVPVQNLIKGEKAKVRIERSKKGIRAQLVSITDKSSHRVNPKCKYYAQCGGCSLQHMDYAYQLEYKENTVRNLMKDFAKTNPILGMDNPYKYRNKVHSTYAQPSKGTVISGIYQEYTHKVVPIDECIIQDPIADEILLEIRKLVKKHKVRIYDEDKKEGFLRHVMIRTGQRTGEVMVVFIGTSKIFPAKNNFVKELTSRFSQIRTIVLSVNDKDTTFVMGERDIVLFGEGFIEDELCGHTFRISPKSFYQINPEQTEKLYGKAIELAALKGKETVIDCYSGVGTISILAARAAGQVIGVELNKDAIENAEINAWKNKVENVEFVNDDAGRYMLQRARDRKKADVVFMDPPRSGSDERFLSSLVRLGPEKVVYISCNPITLARDVSYLAEHGYKAVEIQPVEMFAQTYHVETVVLLQRKNSK